GGANSTPNQTCHCGQHDHTWPHAITLPRFPPNRTILLERLPVARDFDGNSRGKMGGVARLSCFLKSSPGREKYTCNRTPARWRLVWLQHWFGLLHLLRARGQMKNAANQISSMCNRKRSKRFGRPRFR